MNDPRRGQRWRALGRLQADILRAVFARRGGDANQRRSELVRMTYRAGRTLAGARLRGLFTTNANQAALRSAATEKAAADVARAMGDMKGLAMKFGQFASFAGGLDPGTEKHLTALQTHAEPMDYEVVLGILTDELGPRPLARFASFSPEPIAAASVGQVHRATLPDGRAVVVKVQYPGVETAIMTDFDAVADLSRAWALTGVGFDVEAILTDLGSMLRDEFDYEIEAASQTYFAELYRGHPYVKIPEVVPELSRRRVLTSEFVDGQGFHDILDRPQAQRDRYAETIYRFAYGSVAGGVFSCDPHPGNYLFLDDGRVCFLDFGLVERMTPDDHARAIAPVVAAVQDDWDALVAGLTGLGLLPDNGGNPAKLWAELGPLLAGPVDEDTETRLDPRHIGRLIAAAQKPTAEFYKSRKASYQPPWLSMLLRYTMGTMAVLGRLRGAANFHALGRELFLGGTPSTPIGEKWWSTMPDDRTTRTPAERTGGPSIRSRVTPSVLPTTKIDGFVAPGFEPVRAVFQENFDERTEVGAAFAVYLDGTPVVDLWGGIADAGSGAEWQRDTIATVDSSTKALTAICGLMLVDQGLLDLAAPVVEYWPEFAAEGKADIPVSLLFSHQAGLPAVDRWITLDDCEAWHPVVDALAAQRPLWTPGTAHGYHGLTIGWLIGELVRRLSGLTPGQYLARHVAPRLDLDMWIGLPAEHEARVAPVHRVDFDHPDALVADYGDEDYNRFLHELSELYLDPEFLAMYRDPGRRDPSFFRRDLTIGQRTMGPVEIGEDMDSPRYHAMEVPAANGIADARSVARLYAALIGEVDGHRILTPDTVARATRPHAVGPDQVVLGPTAWGLGFAVSGGIFFDAPTPTAFGHSGANGALAIADPAAGLSIGYIRNHMAHKIQDDRSRPLIDALYHCVHTVR
ncbi:serine hydrolase [Actinocrispum wychmicini]|uniref:ABC1 family protein n=1 Tax=Actinocrispum wychmicini TaxID=1213861 RepID=A0A4R2JPL1_9PSEU|nr:serine hydrolase [Actinocrispum wychmicini]TCO62103.1 ABC1 family protein [Actinocrispum wychmicini]